MFTMICISHYASTEANENVISLVKNQSTGHILNFDLMMAQMTRVNTNHPKENMNMSTNFPIL